MVIQGQYILFLLLHPFSQILVRKKKEEKTPAILTAQSEVLKLLVLTKKYFIDYIEQLIHNENVVEVDQLMGRRPTLEIPDCDQYHDANRKRNFHQSFYFK